MAAQHMLRSTFGAVVVLGLAGCSVGGAPDHTFPGVATLGSVPEDEDGSTGGDDEPRPTTGDDESASGAPWTTGSPSACFGPLRRGRTTFIR